MSAETYVEKLASAFTHSTKVVIPPPDNENDAFEMLRLDESIQALLAYYENTVKELCVGVDLDIEPDQGSYAMAMRTYQDPFVGIMRERALRLLEKEKEIEKRKQAVISAYAIRYGEFCKRNASTRRMGASVQVQFRELVEWQKNQ